MNQQDPFAAYRINKAPQETKQISQESQQTGEDPFSQYRIKKADERSGLYEVGRHAARIGSRIAETIGGIPGDVSSLIQSGLITGLNKLGVKPLSEEQEALYRKQRTPTTAELKEFSQEKTKGLTKPQNEAEKFGDEVAQTAASLIGPMKFRRALGVAMGSELAKEGTKVLGLSEGPQEAAKLGTMFMLTALNPGGAMKYASQQYQKANELAKGVSIGVPSLTNNLGNMLQELGKGIPTAPKNVVIKSIEDTLAKVKDGKMLVQDLTAAKRDLNTIMKDPSLLTREKKLLKGVSKEVDNAIKPYERINPEFTKAYRPANEIYGAVMQGTKAYDFIRKGLGTKSFLSTILGEAVLGHPEYMLPTASAAVGVLGSAKTADFFMRLTKSPQLQKYYTKTLAAAASEDLPALRIYAEKLEDEFNRNQHEQAHPTNRENRRK